MGGSGPDPDTDRDRVPEPDGGTRPTTRHAALADELAARDAEAVVAVGDGADPTLRYLTRFVGPDRPYAFVFADGDAALCAPALFEAQARREFAGDVVYEPAALEASAPGARAAEVLAAHGVETGRVLVPADIPHDAAVRLQDAGYELTATDVVARARRTKTTAEVDAVRRTARAAEAGLAAVAALLADAAVDPAGRRLVVDDTALTTGRVRRVADAAMAEAGAGAAGNTVVGAGRTAADLHFQGDVPVRPGAPVLVDVSPRGPAGYHADCTRTFLPGGDEGWVRRAHVAVRSALADALAAVEPGVAGTAVHEAAAAELRAHGFAVDRGGDTGFVHGTGHGVGLALHEDPSLPGTTTLEPGHVVTVEPGVYDPTEGGVRLEELVVVTEDGHEELTDRPLALDPTAHVSTPPPGRPDGDADG